MNQLGTPRNLNEAVETLLAFYAQDIRTVQKKNRHWSSILMIKVFGMLMI